jgi:hypothetical protein
VDTGKVDSGSTLPKSDLRQRRGSRKIDERVMGSEFMASGSYLKGEKDEREDIEI